MKSILTAILVFLIHFNSYSQEVIKKYDKYENKFYLSLKKGIDLNINLENKTEDFNINLVKIFNMQDTAYYIVVIAIHKFKLYCSSVLSKYVIIYDKDKSIVLNPLHYECDEDSFRKKYIFDFQIAKEDLLSLENAKNIKVLITCSDGELQGDFSEDNFEDFRKFIKNYVK